MKEEFDEDTYDSVSSEAKEADDEDELSAGEEGFLRGYEEETDDPSEEKIEEESEY